jgi:hypothetical protein
MMRLRSKLSRVRSSLLRSSGPPSPQAFKILVTPTLWSDLRVLSTRVPTPSRSLTAPYTLA